MKYSVWVGGTEVSDFYMSKKEAKHQAYIWEKIGYDDVAIMPQPKSITKVGK